LQPQICPMKFRFKFMSAPKEDIFSESPAPKQLSEIQEQIVRLVKKGSSSKEISLITGFSLDQIHIERKALMKNMNCNTMYDVMLKLEKHHLS
jgi:DNA-binding NarL/FixJ family response regulator